MEFKITSIEQDSYPTGLLEIPDIPKKLYVVGAPLETDAFYLSVVGSRNHTSYGADVCSKLIKGLAGFPIVIVSGLALGIDSVAHRAALKAGLTTVAFPGSGLAENVLYPATNLSLAKEILAAGGSLVSEFEPSFKATTWSFPRRNRFIAGIAQATLIIEAGHKSGTLITARLALDYNREILAVPGPITSDQSLGTNLLIKQGATPITQSEDILDIFGLSKESNQAQNEIVLDLSPEEKELYDLLSKPRDRDDIITALDKDAHEINMLVSIMEIKGLIKEEYGKIRKG